MSITDQAVKEAVARVESSDLELWVIEIRHSLLPDSGVVRLAQHPTNVDITHELNAPRDAGATVEYLGADLQIDPPGEDTEPGTVARVLIGGVSAQIQPFLTNALKSDEPVLTTFRGVLYDVEAESQVAILKSLHLELRNTSDNMLQVSATFGYTNPATLKFPAEKYTSDRNPGLV